MKLTARRSVPREWWASYRFVLLLATGPSVLALALATAHNMILPVAKQVTLPSGAQQVVWAEPDPADARAERIGEVRVGLRLSTAAVLVLTILTHGAALVSLGLALAAGTKRQACVLGACVCVGLAMTAALPRAFALGAHWGGIGMSNFVISASTLLAALRTRIAPNIAETLASALFWDGVVAVVAVVLAGWSARTVGRRAIERSRAPGASPDDDGALAAEGALARRHGTVC